MHLDHQCPSAFESIVSTLIRSLLFRYLYRPETRVRPSRLLQAPEHESWLIIDSHSRWVCLDQIHFKICSPTTFMAFSPFVHLETVYVFSWQLAFFLLSTLHSSYQFMARFDHWFGYEHLIFVVLYPLTVGLLKFSFSSLQVFLA